MLAISRFIDVVPGRATIKGVDAALIEPLSATQTAVHHRHEARRAFAHRRIDDLPPPGGARFVKCAGDAECQIDGAAAKIANQIERWRWPLALATDRMQGTRQSNVIEIVASGLGQRPVLPPAGDTAVDEAWIACQANIGAQPEALHHARTESLNQRVGFFDQGENQLDRFRLLEV